MNSPLTVALDYETFYSKTYSIRDLGNYGYTHHPEFDPYLLTAATEHGDVWGGPPLEFDYQQVDGAIWIMANAGFDVSVQTRSQKQVKSLGEAGSNLRRARPRALPRLPRQLGGRNFRDAWSNTRQGSPRQRQRKALEGHDPDQQADNDALRETRRNLHARNLAEV
jgi:hypothetical protein